MTKTLVWPDISGRAELPCLKLSAKTPSGDKIRVIVEGDRIVVLMASADHLVVSAADSRQPQATEGDA